MHLQQFANQTHAKCTLPLLDEVLFSDLGGYQPGRYCGLGSFGGTTCCFPCPIQDWLYPPQWQEQFRIPNHLSILSVVLCCFLLLSFAVLPAEATRRHYLSVGLLFPVLFISLSFAIPIFTNPNMCHDDITPNDMKSSMSCVWTGSLVTLGGLGSVVWVFLRSLWLHIRIFWDRDPGKMFKLGSILFGTIVPLIFLVVILAATGFSYRMGQTCLPNHEYAIITFWIWLVIFAILGFLLQAVTTSYCFFVYVRTFRRERRASAIDSHPHRHARAKAENWRNVKRLFLLQWRNILISIFVILGSISFFVVFWTQDSKLGRVFNDPSNIKPVKIWIICLTLSMGDKEECRKYVKNFTVDQTAVLISLIMASLVGIEIFILLFRVSMLSAWRSLFRRSTQFLRKGRPSIPQLTSLDNPENCHSPSLSRNTPLSSSEFSADTSSTRSNPINAQTHRGSAESGISASASANGNMTEMGAPAYCLMHEQVKNATGIMSPPDVQRFDSSFRHDSSVAPSTTHPRSQIPILDISTNIESYRLPPSSLRLVQHQSKSVSDSNHPRSYTPMRNAPSPPYPPSRSSIVANEYIHAQLLSHTPADSPTDPALSGFGVHKSNSVEVRGRILAPIPASFVHVGGAFQDHRGENRNLVNAIIGRASRSGSGGLGMHPVTEHDLDLGIGRKYGGGAS